MLIDTMTSLFASPVLCYIFACVTRDEYQVCCSLSLGLIAPSLLPVEVSPVRDDMVLAS